MRKRRPVTGEIVFDSQIPIGILFGKAVNYSYVDELSAFARKPCMMDNPKGLDSIYAILAELYKVPENTPASFFRYDGGEIYPPECPIPARKLMDISL